MARAWLGIGNCLTCLILAFERVRQVIECEMDIIRYLKPSMHLPYYGGFTSYPSRLLKNSPSSWAELITGFNQRNMELVH